MSSALGIDIGGTGIKAALVDTSQGKLTTELKYVKTPAMEAPDELAQHLAGLIGEFNWEGPVGIGFPGVVINGKIFSAAHLSDKWIKADARAVFAQAFPNKTAILNDADMAGIAEMSFGAGIGMNQPEVCSVLMLTFGTGIGSALFTGGKLVRNTELGHMQVGSDKAENQASAKLKTDLNLSWDDWGERVNRVLNEIEMLFSPELFIIGGGVSENFDKFSHTLKVRAHILPAHFKNDAGLIGAAIAALH